jgi:hypothetical protein
MATLKELILNSFIRTAVDSLIEKKHNLKEQFDNGQLSYMDYSYKIEDIQNDIDALCPIDINLV